MLLRALILAMLLPLAGCMGVATEEKCRNCRGKGERGVWLRANTEDGPVMVPGKGKCPDCVGTGKVPAAE